MTMKEKMIAVLGDLPDNATFDTAIDKFTFLKGIETALQQSDADDVMSQDDFMRELLEEERQYNAARRVDS